MNRWDDYHNFYGQYGQVLKNDAWTFEQLEKSLDWKGKAPALSLYRVESTEKDMVNYLNLLDKIIRYMRDLPNLFSYPRRHLRQEEVIRSMEKVTRINKRTIHHLAAHNEHWKTAFPDVYPLRLLTSIWEDDFALYENVAAVTLIKNYDAWSRQKVIRVEGQLLKSSDREENIRHRLPECVCRSYAELSGGAQVITEYQDLSEKLNDIRETIARCKRSKLFRTLYKESPIIGSLKPTNIFLQDHLYNKVYLLWKKFIILHRAELAANEHEPIQNPKYQEGFRAHTKLLLLFALKTLGFLPRENPKAPIIRGEKLTNTQYKKGNWLLELRETEEDTIVCKFSLYQTYEIALPRELMLTPIEQKQFHIDKVAPNGRTLWFEEPLTAGELGNFRQLLIRKWAINNRDNAGKQEVQQIKEKIEQIPKKKRSFTIYFDVSFDPMPETKEQLPIKEQLPMWFSRYRDKIQGEKIWVKLMPDDLWNFVDDYGDKMYLFASYPYPDTQQRFHILPMSLHDIHSYRRLMKVLLPFLMQLDDKHCPYCAGELQQGRCYNCHFELSKNHCGQCQENYYCARGTESEKPLSIRQESRDSKKYQLQLLEPDEKSGFLNTMPIKGGAFVCPHCLAKEIRQLQEELISTDNQ